MKYFVLFMVAFLTACSSEGVVVNSKPDYLTVFNEFKETDMLQACKKFEEELKKKPYEKNEKVLPYETNMDMEILSDSYNNDSYTANLSCTVNITYSLSSTTFIHKEYEKDLGTLSFDY